MLYKKLQQSILCISLFFSAQLFAREIHLDITTDIGDHAIFKKGDKVNFLLNLSNDAYLFVFYTNANGQVHRLLPEKNDMLLFLNAGWFLPVPGDNLEFIVSEPYGKETISIIALSDVMTGLVTLYKKSSSMSEIVSAYREYAQTNSFDFGYSSKSIQTSP